MAEFIPTSQKVDTTCPVCLDTFKRPRSLPCLHTFCSDCLHGHILNTSQSNLLTAFSCPVCRAQTKPQRPYSQRETWAEQFPINHWIVCFMEETEKEHMRDDRIVCELHPDFTVRLFCVDHDCICCPMCIATEHRRCEDVKELDDVAKKFDHVKETSLLQNALDSSLVFLGDYRRTKHEDMDAFVSQRERVIHDIRNKKEEMIRHLSTLESTVIDSLEELSERTLGDIENDIAWCNTATEIIDNCKQDMDQTISETSKLKAFVVLTKMKHKTKAVMNKNHHSQNNQLQAKKLHIDFEFDDCSINFKDTFREFGKLKILSIGKMDDSNESSKQYIPDVRLQGMDATAETISATEFTHSVPDTQQRNDASRTTWYADMFETSRPSVLANPLNEVVELIGTLKVTDSESENKCWITSLLPMPNDCLIVTDRTDRSLKLMKDEKRISRIKLDSSPWDIARISDTSVAVSYPQENLIRFFSANVNDIVVKFMTTVSILGSPLSCDSTLKISAPCFGITCLSKHIIISCEDCLMMYSLKGKLLHTLSQNSDGRALFRRATFLASDKFRGVVFVSDEGANNVLAIQSAQKSLVSIPKYVYSHPKLRCPQGIAVASDGSTLVCGFGSTTIHKISSGGILTHIIELTMRPWAVAYMNSISNKFIVSVYPESEDCRHIYCFKTTNR